jgi:hypothetical protein
MTAVEATNPIDAIVARAEDFMRSGHIKASRCGPPPKREGIGRGRGKGRAFEWLCKHISFDEKKCLFWPFSKSGGHPGLVGYCGRIYSSTRLMCLLAHGAPPSNHHQPAHTCGRGNKGCIHPEHLAWKHRRSVGRTSTKMAVGSPTAGVERSLQYKPLCAHGVTQVWRGDPMPAMIVTPTAIVDGLDAWVDTMAAQAHVRKSSSTAPTLKARPRLNAHVELRSSMTHTSKRNGPEYTSGEKARTPPERGDSRISP